MEKLRVSARISGRKNGAVRKYARYEYDGIQALSELPKDFWLILGFQ